MIVASVVMTWLAGNFCWSVHMARRC